MQGNLTTSTIAVGVLAILVGLVGAYAIRQGMMQGDDGPPEQVEENRLLVPLALSDLPKGRVIQLGDVALSRMTADEMEQRNIDTSQAMMVPEQVIGRRLKEAVRAGKPFLASSLYLEGSGPDISELLKPGYRAASIQVPPTRGGAVLEGALVDVLFRSEAREATEFSPAVPERSIALIDGVEVLKVQPPAEDDRDAIGPTITIAVTPEDARVLQTVAGHGEISLVTRRPDELGSSRGDEALTLDELLGIEPPPQPTPPWITEVYYRTDKGANRFPATMITPPYKKYADEEEAPEPAPEEAGDGADKDADAKPELLIPDINP